MGEVSMNSGGLFSSISSMYDNPLFSDVEFIFASGKTVIRRIHCHSFILAIRSEVFASMFFGDSKKKLFHRVELPHSRASSFSLLVRFLYTDDLQSLTFEEALELYDLAKEYAVEELQQKCSKYILNERLDVDNIFSKYDYALSKGVHVLLKECQNFVCSNSQLVLESDGFTNASNDVVEDIVKLDKLSVRTELQVIGAVLKWGSKELKRKKVPFDEKNLRKCIDPFKKYLRFLTLKREEFNYLIENYDIFSSKESSKLTEKIINPQCYVFLPDSLSSIDVKRNGEVSSKYEPSVSHHRISPNAYAKETSNGATSFGFNQNGHRPEPLFENVSSKCESSVSCHRNSPNSYAKESSNDVTSFGFNQNGNRPKPLFENASSNKILYDLSATTPQSVVSSNYSYFATSLKSSTSENFLKSSPAYVISSQVSPKILTPLNSEARNVPKFHTSDTNKVYEIKKMSLDETSQRSNGVSSSQRIRDSSYVAQTMRVDSSRFRDFEFHLQESLRSFETSFQNDVKSTITFQMITGNMLLHGFEIKVESKSNQTVEELKVDVDLKGFSNQPFSKLYEEKLINDVIFIKFPENMVLHAGKKGVLEVSIDNLLLDRCGTCNGSKELQLNSSNSFSCEMNLSTTQNNKGGFFFLISKLTYVPC